mmetsp:Transcript_20188/g.19434  ORF Transcript_20188/g.19434 Transcript_20188/m.19434 type:complete len:87 (-) Transcript_20188:354-614(-)
MAASTSKMDMNSERSEYNTSYRYSRGNRRQASKISNPVVLAMLNSNNLGDCVQVKDLYMQCVESGSSSALCDTASQYFVNCSRGEN